MRAVVAVFVGIVAALLPARGRADEVVVAIGLSLPPYMIADELRGIEFDIIKRALALEGHTLSPRWMPLARVPRDLEAGAVDAATPMTEASGIKAWYSQPHITYRNYAITLAGRNLKVDGVEDLADKSVIAFQNARQFLGSAYAAAVARNPRYREETRQQLQPLMLFHGRTDVVVADRNIFAWFADTTEVKDKADTSQALRFHPLFAPTDYSVAFRDEALRDSFDRGLKRLRDSGEYGKIVESYSRYLHEEGTEPARRSP
jgi:polar amino acid transport system substrate-binding protein